MRGWSIVLTIMEEGIDSDLGVAGRKSFVNYKSKKSVSERVS
jgi:hypothetical protein